MANYEECINFDGIDLQTGIVFSNYIHTFWDYFQNNIVWWGKFHGMIYAKKLSS